MFTEHLKPPKLPPNAKELFTTGRQMLLDGFRKQNIFAALTAHERMALRTATGERLTLFACEQDNGEDTDIEEPVYGYELSVDLDGMEDSMTGMVIPHEAIEMPQARIERSTDITANEELTTRLLMQLPPKYRKAIAALITRKAIKYVKHSANAGEEDGTLEKPEEYLEIRYEALMRLYRAISSNGNGTLH